ncbi:MAG: ubiquinol-cytochrome c reductase iron-sulfur subunit [Betaproteobacteria bacterium]
MSSSDPATPAPPNDAERRNMLIATGVVGGAGAAALVVPFVASFGPSERARAAGAPVSVDVAGMAPGEMKRVEWRGQPVWVLRRTPELLESLKKTTPLVADPNSQRTAYPTPAYAQNEWRSIKPEYLVAVGICTHLGCSPVGPLAAGANATLGDVPGFLCPCHGSTFDLAGRVFKNKPAPDNLPVPPYKFLSETSVLVGEDSKS